MAGVGSRLDAKIHPKESFGHIQLFGMEEYSSRGQSSGGGVLSRRSDLDERRVRTQERLTLEDVRWSDMRKKVPLMGRIPQSKMEIQDDESFQKQKVEHISYIRQTFNQYECQKFVPLPNQGKIDKVEALKCHCGEVLKLHVPYEVTPSRKPNFGNLIPQELKPYISVNKPYISVNDLKVKPPEKFPNVEWKAAKDLVKKPTTSFGKVRFTGIEQVGGMKPAKYLRLVDVENPDVVDKVITLMKDYWRIMEPKTPSLIISVVGGAKNFKLSGKMRETFQSGLIKASQTTNAWLITSGFNMGAMKEVGLAVREGQSFEWYKDRFAHVLRCIGIAPWGYVKNRHVLTDHSLQVQGKFDKIAEYKTSNIIEHLKPVPLNSDHTHFIFVDDGHRNSYRGVNKFRARFEKRLSDPVDNGGEGIPVVLIVVEGGKDAIEDAKTSLAQNIPVLLCDGTGRAADILVYAYNNPEREPKIKRMIKKAYFDLKPADKNNPQAVKDSEEKTAKVFENVKSCIEKKHLISIFHMNKHEELDNEILKILLKAKTGVPSEQQRLERLKLALKWDRADIAQEEIFREDALWSRGSFDESLKNALIADNVRFVQIILNQGVVMREYLTVTRLMDLYKEALKNADMNNLPLRKVLGKLGYEEITKENLVKILERLMDRFDLNLIEKVQENNDEDQNEDEPQAGQFTYPYKHLLVWSVLLLRQNMANFALKMGGEPITSTVAASRIYYSLAKYIHRNELALKNRVLLYKEEFDNLSSDVLEECHERDPNKAMMLAERKSPMWSKMTSMQMAASADNQTYLSSVACQNSISTIWKRGIASSWEKVLMVGFLPFLAATPLLEIEKLGDKKQSPFYKFLTFLTSPIANFTYSSIMYLIFLMLFTYFVLVEFRKDYVTPIEILCIIWIFTFIVDNLHTCLAFPSPTLKGTIRDWFGLLKFLDLGNCILALIAFFIHYNGTHYRHAKAIFCVNAVVFYIRLLEVYTVNSRLGPKMVMIKRMMMELVMFILVLTVFLVAYGIVSQGLLYLQRRSGWVVLKDVIYFPYWQFYGELFLDEIKDDDDCPETDTDFCRTSHWLVPFFLAGYLLIGNVLLLNLLIAIFSNVFHEVEENSNRIWKYQMYLLVMEFDTKTALVPPLSIFIHIYLIIKWIFRKTCCKKSKGRQYGSRHLEYLQLFEKEQLSTYLRKKKAEAKSSTDISILSMQKRIDELYKMIKEELLDEADQTTVERETSKAGLDRETSKAGLERKSSKTGLKTESSEAGLETRILISSKSESGFVGTETIKETAVTDKEEERKEKKHRKKKKKKKAKEDEEKLLNIDQGIQKPELDKIVQDLPGDKPASPKYREKSYGPSLPPHGKSSGFQQMHRNWNSDSDSDEGNINTRPMYLNIRHEQNDFSKEKRKRSRSKPQDSISEEDVQYRGSRIRQKLRKKRSSSFRSDSDS